MRLFSTEFAVISVSGWLGRVVPYLDVSYMFLSHIELRCTLIVKETVRVPGSNLLFFLFLFFPIMLHVAVKAEIAALN